MTKLKKCARAGTTLWQGVQHFQKTRSTPESAYFALRNLFCWTNGRSNDVLHQVVRLRHPAKKLPPARGLLGELSPAALNEVASSLRRDGCYTFPTRLPSEICDELQQLAEISFCTLRPKPSEGPHEAVYDRQTPKAVGYYLRERDLIANARVQSMMADISMQAVAQSYLGCAPVLDLVSMWWSTAAARTASSEAAQLYHQDLDRIKFLKFFFYLTDVTPDTGPHCYVKGSHRSGRQPQAILKQGCGARIPDEEMLKHFPAESMVELTGRRGTILAVDTRGLHKGKPLACGERLILQFEFADSLFGSPSPQTPIARLHEPALAEAAQRNPRMLERYPISTEVGGVASE